jgi:hypothetical protein
MRFAGLTYLGCAALLSGCLGAQAPSVVPLDSVGFAAEQTCRANFGLSGSAGGQMSADIAQQMNGCIVQASAGGSGTLAPLIDLTPVPLARVAAATVSRTPPRPSGCVANRGVMQGGVSYCVGSMR